MPKLSSEIERISKQYKSSEHVVVGVWTKKDILARAKKLKIDVSAEDANDVLAMLQEDFDPMVGINSKVIDEALADVTDGLVNDDRVDEGDDEIDPVDPDDVAGFYPSDDEK